MEIEEGGVHLFFFKKRSEWARTMSLGSNSGSGKTAEGSGLTVDQDAASLPPRSNPFGTEEETTESEEPEEGSQYGSEESGTEEEVDQLPWGDDDEPLVIAPPPPLRRTYAQFWEIYKGYFPEP